MEKPKIKFLLGTQMIHVEGITQEQAADAYSDMIDALIELVFLNQCELEGLRSGQPTAEQWYEAFEKAEEALEKAGCTE